MKSTFRTLFYVKRDKKKLDGTLPVMCRITINGRASRFNTKISIKPELWDAKAYCAKGRSKEAKEINALLNDIRTSIHNVYHQLIVHENNVSAEEVKNSFLGVNVKGRTLIEVLQIYNDDIKKLIGNGKSLLTYNRYELVRKRISCFLQEHYQLSDIPLKDVDHEFIHNFNIFVMTKYKCGVNTVGKFMQRFRSVILMAKNNGWIQSDPFINFKIKFVKTDRGYLNEHEVDTIMSKKFPVQRLSQVRDIFIFCCYTGLSYIDVKNLRQTHIQTGFDDKLWIMGKREKTGVSFNVPLLDIPRSILDKYALTIPDNKLLPVLSNQKMNAYLKEIGDICGIEKDLTFHLARHTFATLALSKGVSIESVSKMLGHTDIKTTQIYAKIIDEKVSQDMSLFSEKLKTKNNEPQSGLDLLFKRLSLREKLALFNLPISFSKNIDSTKQITKLWYGLSESEKSNLWHNTFKNKVIEEKSVIEADDSGNTRLRKII